VTIKSQAVGESDAGSSEQTVFKLGV